ncbi:MAG: hypothetical protein U0R24_12750 [Solirubrobacterales bacterium]
MPLDGVDRALRAAYALLAIAAGARALVQLATDPGRAPLAYTLSAVAACVYGLIAATIARPERRRIAIAACALELAGVLLVGALTLADPGLFPDDTVWSGFGSGYGFVPLLLPPLALWWLLRAVRPHPATGSAAAQAGAPPNPTSLPSGSR